MATKTDIQAELATIVEEIAGVPADDVQPDKEFVADLDVDSLSMVEIVVAAEEKFGVRIPDDQVKNLKTVGDAVDYIDSAAGMTGTASRRHRAWAPPHRSEGDGPAPGRRCSPGSPVSTPSSTPGPTSSGPRSPARSRSTRRRARPGQGPPARPLRPARAWSRPSRRGPTPGWPTARRSTPSGSRSPWPRASAACRRCCPTTTRCCRRARGGSPRWRSRC